jgi:uncharacterized protein
MNRDFRAFLGRGLAFPLRIGPHGGFSLVRGEQDVEQAIWIVLSTARGERLMRPTFGCGIHDLVFAPNSPETRARIAHEVRTALTDWEPRIDVVEVRVERGTAEEQLLIRIDYRIRTNNALHNVVVPFWFQEGERS